MKKYIEPKSRIIKIDTNDLYATSPLGDIAVGQSIDGEESVCGDVKGASHMNLWDDEW